MNRDRKYLKYKHIAEDLEKQILSGTLKSGTKLPGAFQLSKRYNTSMVTANKALDELVRTGLVNRIPRSGTYVKEGKDRLQTILLPCSSQWFSDNPQLLLYLNGIIEEANRLQVQIRLEPYDSPMFDSGETVKALGCQGIFQLGDADVNFPCRALRSSNLPWVAVGVQDSHCDHFIMEDRFNAAIQLVRSMRDNGAEKIAMIADLSKANHRYCRDGYIEAIKDNDIGASLLRDSNASNIDAVLNELLAGKNIDGLIVCGAISIRVVAWLWQHQIQIPVGCFKESAQIGHLEGMTNVADLNLVEVGKKGVQVLSDLVAGNPPETQGTLV